MDPSPNTSLLCNRALSFSSSPSIQSFRSSWCPLWKFLAHLFFLVFWLGSAYTHGAFFFIYISLTYIQLIPIISTKVQSPHMCAGSQWQWPSSGCREAICKVQSAPTTTVRYISSLYAYSYIQQSGRRVKSMNAKNMIKSPIHDNVDAKITCNFGEGDISRSRSWLPYTHTATPLARL